MNTPPRTLAYVSSRWRTLFVVTPKAACTSLLWAFAGLQEEPMTGLSTSLAPETTRALVIHDPHVWEKTQFLHHLSEQERDAVLSEEGWFRFAVTRHPVDRLWSAWQSKLLLREPAYLARFGSRPWFPRPPASLEAIVEDFARFVSALKDEPGLLQADVHWQPQAQLLAADSFPYTHLGRVESLGTTIKQWHDHLLAQGRKTPLTIERANASLLERDVAVRSSGVLDTIEALYRDDLQTFGYKPCRRAKQRVARQGPTADVAVRAMAAIVERHDRLGDLQRAAVSGSRPARAAVRSPRSIRTSLSLIVVAGAEQVEPAIRKRLNVDDDVEIIVPPASRAGLASQFQAGCDAANGDILVLCRELVALSPGWADEVRRRLMDKTIGAVGAVLIPDGSAAQRLTGLRFVDDLLTCHWRASDGNAAAPSLAQPAPALSSVFLGLRAQALRDVGGLDTGMLGDTCHDVELCIRLWRSGLECQVLSLVTGMWRAPFGQPETGQHLQNLLRMAAIHLPTDRWCQMLAALRLDPALPNALAHVLTSNVGALRNQLEGAATRDFDEFWTQWGGAADRASRAFANAQRAQRRRETA